MSTSSTSRGHHIERAFCWVAGKASPTDWADGRSTGRRVALRTLRLRRALRQVDLGRLAGASDVIVSRVERGDLDRLSLRTVRRIAAALDVRLELQPRSHGADLDRAINARHAALAEHVIRGLRARGGWSVRPEVSFSIYGERGVIDLLAWHAAARIVLVVELKTAIVDVGELLGTLDRKRRLAPRIAAAELGWEPLVVAVWLAIAESMTSRRRVAEHGVTFAAALPDDGRRLRRWLDRPDGEFRGLSFVTDRRREGPRSRFATLQRAPSSARAVDHARGSAASGVEQGRRPSPAAPTVIKHALHDDL